MATLYDQPKDTYGDTVAQVRVISNAIQLVSPRDVAFIDAVGGLDSARSKFQIAMNGKKVELLEDEDRPYTTALNHGTTVTTNTLSLTVADASIFHPGHVVLIDSEYMIVTAVDNTGNTVTIESRSFGGTNATHAATAAVEIVGVARVEGEDASFSGIVALTNPYNYTQIFEDGLSVTGTEEAIDQYGFDSAFNYQANKKLPELLKLVNRSAYHGIRNAGASTKRRTFGGLKTFITNNTIAVGGAVTKTAVDNLSEMIHLDGGNPDLFVCAPQIARDLKDIIDTSAFVRMTQDNTSIGMAPLGTIQTQYHNLMVVMDRWCPVADAYMLESGRVGYYTLRPFGWQPLAITGDATKAELKGEITLLVANDVVHGRLATLTS